MLKKAPNIVSCTLTGLVFLFTYDLLTYIHGGRLDIAALSLISVALDIAFALFTLFSLWGVQKSAHGQKNFEIYYIWMLSFTTLGLMGDALSHGLFFNQYRLSPYLVPIGHFLRYFCGFPLLILYNIYLISYIKEDKQELKRYAILVGGLCADGILLVVLSCFTAHDPVNPWLLNDHPWFFFFFLAMPISVSIGIIFSFRKMLTNRKALAFLFYELFVACTVVVDILFKSISFGYIAVAYSLHQIYITLQIEYEKTQEEQLARQRISMMLSQIQPHFLYNVLTGIRALCRIDARKAETALTDFTIFLRGNLNSLQNKNCIPFLQELEHTMHYINLEKMRFGEDLQVTCLTPVTDFSIPPLTLEPIVENAVRHGIIKRKGGGTILLRTEETAHEYLIYVIDNGTGFDVSSLSLLNSNEHIGIQNVQERLKRTVGGSLIITSKPHTGTTVQIIIPKR